MDSLAGSCVRGDYVQVCLLFIFYADEHCGAGTRLELVNVEDFSGKAHTPASSKPCTATDDAMENTTCAQEATLCPEVSCCW